MASREIYRFKHCPELTEALRLPVPIDERGKAISVKTAKRVRSKRYRTEGDWIFAYFSLASGTVLAALSPAVMQRTEDVGGGDLKWAFPVFAAIALGYGAKLLYGRK